MPTRFERMWGQIRSWRGSDGPGRAVAPKLPDSDLERIRRLLIDTIDGRGGEMASRKRATEIGALFLSLDSTGRRRFFELLAYDFGHDDREVDAAIAAVTGAADQIARSAAERRLRDVLRPKRERLFRRFVGLEGGLSFLVDLREELLPLRELPHLQSVDDDLRVVLSQFFDVGLLRLERLSWHSPAAVLEKLIEYEAVHEIRGWHDLRGRLDTGRRCYAFFHPAMAEEPLIFVEVAFTRGIPRSLPPLLDHSLDRTDPFAADTATFYSISNCHDGLAGVPLGDLLIKSVVDALLAEFPELDNLVTLSPLPGLRSWLATERPHLAERLPDALPPSPEELEGVRENVLAAAATYLVDERRPSSSNRFRGPRSIDPVAHFHLSNGALIERINWWANPTPTGWQRSLGLMVNYRYEPSAIDRHHDTYGETGTAAVSDAVQRLLRR